MKRDKFKFLKLLSEYRSLKYELKYVKEVLGDIHLQFQMFYIAWCAENGVDLEELTKRNQRRIDMSFVMQKSHKIKQNLMLTTFKEEQEDTVDGIKPAYKAIARKLHPDLLNQDDPRFTEYEEDFKRASAANEEGRWGELFDIIDKHNITLKDYKDAIDCLRFDIERVDADLKKEKGTYNWLYSQAETEQERIQIVKGFLKHMYRWQE